MEIKRCIQKLEDTVWITWYVHCTVHKSLIKTFKSFWCTLFSKSDLILGVGSLSYVLGKYTLNRPYLSLTTSTVLRSFPLELSVSSTAINLQHLA